MQNKQQLTWLQQDLALQIDVTYLVFEETLRQWAVVQRNACTELWASYIFRVVEGSRFEEKLLHQQVEIVEDQGVNDELTIAVLQYTVVWSSE